MKAEYNFILFINKLFWQGLIYIYFFFLSVINSFIYVLSTQRTGLFFLMMWF